MVNFEPMTKKQNLLDSDDDSNENTQDLLESKNVNYGLLDDDSDNDLDLSQSEMNTVERPHNQHRDDNPSQQIGLQQQMPNFADLRSIEQVNDTSHFSKNLADEFLGGITSVQ